jgi:hypothetical protein
MSSVISGASTASTVGKMSHTSESLNTLSPSLRKSNDLPLTPKLRHPIVTEEDSLGTAACRDNSKATSDTTNMGKGFKPSGLRRPTPKIGYFDAVRAFIFILSLAIMLMSFTYVLLTISLLCL